MRQPHGRAMFAHLARVPTRARGAEGTEVRIALVTPYFSPVVGGIETHVSQLAAGLNDARDDVVVVALARDAAGRALPTGPTMVHGIRLFRLPARLLWGAPVPVAWPRLARFDLIHFHGFSRPLYALAAVVRLQTPMVVTLHGGIQGVPADPASPLRLLRLISDRVLGRPLLRRASQVIALTDVERDFLIRRRLVAPSRIAVIPNPLPRRPEAPRPSPPSPHAPIVCLSRLAARKRLLDLVEAARRSDEIPPIHIYGPDGDAAPDLRAAIRSLPPGRVELRSAIDPNQRCHILRSARAVVIPSEWEGLSMTALESVGGNVPVVASTGAASGLPAGAALTYPTGDIEALVACLRGLVDPAAWLRAAESSWRASKTMLDAAAWVQETRRLYESVLSS